MLQGKLREAVLEANLELVRRGLVLSTFGNASGVARDEGLIVIKPCDVPYNEMRPEHLVVTDLQGNVVEGTLRPSSDLATHAALYRAFPSIGGIAHTHSEYATAWAQARKPIPNIGGTHGDYFHGPIPLTEAVSVGEITGEHKAIAGGAIIRAYETTDPMNAPAILVANDGSFAWGSDPREASENAWKLEAVARAAYYAACINPYASFIGKTSLGRQFLRMCGQKAQYNQTRTKA